MGYKKYKTSLFLRILFVLLSALIMAFSFVQLQTIFIFGSVFLVLYSIHLLYRFVFRRFEEMDSFFESVRYKDFSRWFAEKAGTEDINELHKGFNQVNKTIKDINNEKEAQHIYHQKILEIIETGIIAYNVESLDVLWINEFFKKSLNIPQIKNIQFIEKRKPKLYQELFGNDHMKGNTIIIENGNDKNKMMVSTSKFKLNEVEFQLLVLQNIDEHLNRNESEAWKKLLSVMTHEIMNSIAPISSLAETLQATVRDSMKSPKTHTIDIEDLEMGLETIKSRSKGLFKFAQIYRSLNKITELNLEKVNIKNLFENIQKLMQSSLTEKDIAFEVVLENQHLQIEIDQYLIEQVLINLILNASEACKDIIGAKIKLSAVSGVDGSTTIKVIDNGVGIPDEIMDRIFIPFFTSKKNGSGIGLSLSKQIMLLHHGKIQVVSQPKKGTAIYLYFYPNKSQVTTFISSDQVSIG